MCGDPARRAFSSTGMAAAIWPARYSLRPRRYMISAGGACFFLAGVLEGLLQQGTSRWVARIHLERVTQGGLGVLRILPAEIRLAQKHVGSAAIGVQPDGALELGNGVFPCAPLAERIPEPVVGHGEVRIDFELLPKFTDGLPGISAHERRLAQNEVCLRKARVDLQRAAGLTLRSQFHLLAQHHVRQQQVRRRRLGLHLKDRGEGALTPSRPRDPVCWHFQA